jgi:phage shock protein PspC (stress-responsive transcriptional regulator)
MKTLTRSSNNKIFFGIFGGLGEYFGVDPVLLRIGYVALTFMTGFFPGAVAYLVSGLIVPKNLSEKNN